MSALRECDREPWVVTCDLCERTTITLPADLDVAALGVAINKAGWATPFYGGTFEPKCWATMRRINKR